MIVRENFIIHNPILNSECFFLLIMAYIPMRTANFIFGLLQLPKFQDYNLVMPESNSESVVSVEKIIIIYAVK